MSNSVLDDLGFDPTPTHVAAQPAVSSGPPPPLPDEPDAYLLARTALAEGDQNNPESWQNVAGAVWNRAQKSGQSVAKVLAEPKQFEAYGNGHIQAVDTSTPQFQAALGAIQPVITGAVKVPYDSFYQPEIVASRGVTPPFPASTGTKIGTQVFGVAYKPPGSEAPAPGSSSALEDLGFGASPNEPVPIPGANPRAPNAPDAPILQGPELVYDPAAGVTRHADGPQAGSVAAVGDITETPPKTAVGVPGASGGASNDDLVDTKTLKSKRTGVQYVPVAERPGFYTIQGQDPTQEYMPDLTPSPSTGKGLARIAIAPPSAQPGVISQWLADHPNDPANRLTQFDAPNPALAGANLPSHGPIMGKWGGLLTPALASGQSVADTGLVQGAANIGNSFTKAQLWADQNLPAWVTGLNPQGQADLAQRSSENLVSRLRNENRFGGDPNYETGKFVGSVAATAPIAAAGGVALDALPGVAGVTEAANAAGPLGRFALATGRGAIEGGIAGAAQTGGNNMTLGQNIEQGAEGGAMVAPVAMGGQAAGRLVGIGANRFMGGGAPQVSPELASIVDTAQNRFGLNLRGTQIQAAAERDAGVTNGPAAIADSELLKTKGSGYAASQAQLRADITRNASHTIGLDTPNLTPENVGKAFDQIGAVFDTAGARNGIAPEATAELTGRLNNVLQDADEMGLDESQKKALGLQVAKINDAIAANDGRIPGDVYLNLTGSNSSLSRIIKKDNTAFGESAGDIKDALNDAVLASSSPEDVAALRQARFQYKNLMTLLPLINKAESSGYINPILLRAQVIKKFGDAAYAKDQAGPLGTLARVARITGDLTGDSGTKARITDMMKGVGGLTELTGALGSAWLHDPAPLLATTALNAGAAGIRYGQGVLRGAIGRGPALKNALLGTYDPGVMTPIGNFVNPLTVSGAVAGTNRMLEPAR